MDFVLYHMMKLHNVHIAYSDILFKSFSCTPIKKFHFASFGKSGFLQLRFDFISCGAGKRRNNRLITKSMRSKTQMKFQNLSQVHTAWHAKRRQNNINRSSILHIWHIFFRKNSGNNSFIPVTSGKLVTNRNISKLGNFNMNSFYNFGIKFVTFLSRENLHLDNSSAFSSLHAL